MSMRVLLFVSRRKALVHSVIAPALLAPIRHHQHFHVDQSSRRAARSGVPAGNLPHEGFLGHVPADFDDIAGFENVLCETSSSELKEGSPLSELATAAGLDLRTIQRIEREASASFKSSHWHGPAHAPSSAAAASLGAPRSAIIRVSARRVDRRG